MAHDRCAVRRGANLANETAATLVVTGAMIFVISDEIIPETHRRDHQNQATFGLMIGFVLMMFLDVALG